MDLRFPFTSAVILAVYATTASFAQNPRSGYGASGNVSGPRPAAPSQPAFAAQSPSGAQQAVMGQRQFDIPFNVARTGNRPNEVQLYVSRDSGQQWSIAARQLPTDRQFSFLAPDDGWYWFATRTIDTAGNAHPNTPTITPELMVLVDTTEPDLDVQADADSNGTIELNLAVADAALVPSQIQVIYMADTDRTQWVTLDLDPQRLQVDGQGVVRGKLQFTPRQDWRYVNVRAVALDRAGNQSVVSKQVERPRVAGIPAQFATNQPSRSPATVAANVARPNPYLPASSSSSTAAPGLTPPALNAPQQLGQVEAEQPSTLVPQSPSSVMRPIDIETLPAPQGTPYAPGANSSQQLAAESDNLLESTTAATPTPLPTVDESEIRYTRVNMFELAYEVDSIGSQGVAAVELWATRDNGLTWANWGHDEDKESPFDIETKGSGLYGFKLVVVGQNGLTSPPPQPGEPADIYIRVDTAAPRVHLTAARYGQGSEAGSLVIEYTCEDEHLIGRPISLSFSPEPSGPWTTIATGLENTGRYVWPADPRLPRQIYLRIEASDRAGNIGIESTTKPISVQGLAPTGRIRGFQPIN